MITKSQFASLRGGDLILWNGKYLRTILSGPADKGHNGKSESKCLSIDLPIRHRSWTNRAVTVYNWNDLKHKIHKVSKRVRGLLLKSEVEVLKAARFDVRKELNRQIHEEEELCKRRRRLPCAALERIKRLAS